MRLIASESSLYGTVAEAVAANASARPNAPAIVYPNGAVLDYAGLQQQISSIGEGLISAGLSGRRIAVMLPDGPELAIALAAVACHATAAPLNPNLAAAELEQLCTSQSIDAIMTPDWAATAAHEAARRLTTCILSAQRISGGLAISASSPLRNQTSAPRSVAPDDAAFILRTSGTTARPKQVAVTHRNLLAMAQRLQAWFELSHADRVLCVAPLHYAQGLKSALFTPLILGGSLACPVRSTNSDFLKWLSELQPTWYSAGPALHRSVLERARLWSGGKFAHSLRFIQSASAEFPEEIRQGLQGFFDVPVVDSYGASETGLVAANSVSPGGSRTGSVGKPWREELAIRSDEGCLLSAGQMGEIVVRGPGVTPGYIDDAEANQAAFVDGWFRTGDLGHIDADGFLFLAGRIKDLINRGGEKIAPPEIDAALLRHPAVVEAAAFAMAHPRLGEDVAAAVVLRAGASVSELELRQHLRSTLEPFKIPRRIHFVGALPKGATGKVSRRELAARMAATHATSGEPQTRGWLSSLEMEIGEIWARLLGRSDFGRDDEFFLLGGDSLLATQMLMEVERHSGRALPDDIMFAAATVRQIAEFVLESTDAANDSLIVEHQGGPATPLLFIDGDFGGGGYYVRKIARLLGPEQPFYQLRSHALHGETIPTVEQMAKDYVPLVQSMRPHGPYRLCGYCNGGAIAWELARLLMEAGETVELVGMIDPVTINARSVMAATASALDRGQRLFIPAAKHRNARTGAAMLFLWRSAQYVEKLTRAPPPADTRRIAGVLRRVVKAEPWPTHARYRRMMSQFRRTLASYVPRPLAVNVLFLTTEHSLKSMSHAPGPWRALTPSLSVALIPGDHLGCITTHADTLASVLRAEFARAERKQIGG